MTADKIFVCANDSMEVTLNSGRKVKAMMLPRKGDSFAYCLMNDRSLVKLKKEGLGRGGPKSYFSSQGYAEATSDNEFAVLLQDLVDCEDGKALIEKHTVDKAAAIRAEFGGSSVMCVPFHPEKEITKVVVEKPNGFITTMFDLSSRFSAGSVAIEFNEHHISSISLSTHWLVPTDAPAMPQLSDYGGVVEHAVFVICNSGLATLSGATQLQPQYESDDLPRGRMDLLLQNGDTLIVGIDGLDELEVRYERAGSIIYTRNGLNGLSLGEAVGSIAGALIHVSKLDAIPVKKGKSAK